MASARDIENTLVARHGGIDRGATIDFRCPQPGNHRNGDRNPSANWNKRKMAWRCYVCPAKGGMLELAKLIGADDGEVEYPGHGHRDNARRKEDVNDWVEVARYLYPAKGQVFTKIRLESPSTNTKTFSWEPSLKDAGVTLRDFGLFGLESLRAGEPVLFLEGEEKTKVCHTKGLAAVCLAGSSSQRDFGDALKPLYNMDVWLWADNDEAGRDLMAALNAALKPVAKSVHVVAVPLPPKGDAADYFRGGGTVEAIWESDATKPAFDVVKSDHILAKVPSEKGTVQFEFLDLFHTPRAIEAEVIVKVNGFDTAFHWSGNVLNPSARSGVARDLRAYYYGQADVNWTRAVNTAFHGAISAYNQLDPSVEAFTIPAPEDPGFLVPPLLPRDQPTVWFSMGGVAKTYLALIASAHVALGREWPGYKSHDYVHDKGEVLFLDYETCADRGATFRRRLGRVAAGLGRDFIGGIRYWPGNGVPMHDQLDTLSRLIRERNVRLMVIDSALGACGGAPEDSSTVQRFFADVAKLPPVTMLVISHITKPRRDKNGDITPEATEYPFGSIHWHNQARATWYLEGEALGPDDKALTFRPRKANDGPWPSEQRLVLNFDGWNGPVRLETRYDYNVRTNRGYSSFPDAS